MKLLIILIPFIIYAGNCDSFYYNKPAITGPHIELCNEYFVTEYSPLTKTPIYSANVLTKSIVSKSGKIGRKDTFHEDTRLHITVRSTVKDYRNRGYDKGHVISSDDMPDFKSQNESFLMSNIVPQNTKINRGVWKSLEREAREYTLNEPKVYVISGPIYDNNNTRIGNDIIVPTRMFKIIILPIQKRTLVYIVNNYNDADVNITTLIELQKIIPVAF